MIGMHGAGMAHALFLQKHAHIIEIFPVSQRRYGYRNIAQYLELSYTEFRGGMDGPLNSKTISITNWDVFFNNWVYKHRQSIKGRVPYI